MKNILDTASPRLKGADVSSLLEVEAAGGRFFDAEKAFPLGGRCPSAHTGADEGTPRQLDLSDLTPVQRQIAEALMDGPLQLDTLIDKTGLPASQILPQLTVLQIKKTISQEPGKIYKLSGG